MVVRRTSIFLILLLLAGSVVWAQTFEVNGQSSTSSSAPAAKKGKGKRSSQSSAGAPRADTGMGWGSSIEVARQARAAQEALDKGNYAAAMDYATRATR